MYSDTGLPLISSLMNGWSQMAMGFGSTGRGAASTFLLPQTYCVSYRERKHHGNSSSALPKTRCWSTYQVHTPTCSLPHSIHFGACPRFHHAGRWKQDSKTSNSKRITLTSARKSPNRRAQKETLCPLSSLRTSPVPLFRDILFYFGWWRVRMRETQSSNRATVVLYYGFCLHVDSHHWTASSLIRALLHLFRAGRGPCPGHKGYWLRYIKYSHNNDFYLYLS